MDGSYLKMDFVSDLFVVLFAESDNLLMFWSGL